MVIRGKYEQPRWSRQEAAAKKRQRNRMGERIFALVLALTLVYSSAGFGISLWKENRAYEKARQEQAQILEAQKQKVMETYETALAAAGQASQRGDYRAAAEHLSICLALVEPGDPLEGELRGSRAFVSLLQGRPEDALGDLRRLLELDPEDSRAMLLKAQTELDTGRDTQAAEDFASYLQLQPEDEQTMLRLSNLYEQQENYTQAARWYEALWELKPEESYLLNSARCCTLAEEYETAERLLDQFLDPTVPRTELGSAYYLRGMNRMLGGDPAAAVPDFITAVSAGYDPAACIEQAINCTYLLGDSSNLVGFAAQYERLPQKGDGAGNVYRLAGLTELDRGDTWAAEQWLDQSLEADPDQPGTVFSRGLCMFQRRRYMDAEADFSASIEAGYLVQRSHYNRGLCNLRLGRKAQAKEDLEMAAGLTEDPELAKTARETLQKYFP